MKPIFFAGGLTALAAAGLAFAQDPMNPSPLDPPTPTQVAQPMPQQADQPVPPQPVQQVPTQPVPQPVTGTPAPQPAGPVVIVDGVRIPVGPAGVYRGRVPGLGSANVIVGSGNGFGNSIVVDGAKGAVTVVRNSRNGVGNRIVVSSDDDDWFDVPFGNFVKPAPAPAPTPAPTAAPVYRGKATKFWSDRAWSDAHDCYLYWSVKHEKWFRYQRDDDSYRVVTDDAPPAPVAQPAPVNTVAPGNP